MKILRFIIIFLLTSFLLCGFSLRKKDVSFIVFSKSPINQKNLANSTRSFSPGEKIYYMVYLEKGFQDDLIRVQILKKDMKVDFGGYSVKSTNDNEVVYGSSNFLGDISVYEPGVYIMQIVEFAHPSKAVAIGMFKVE